MFDSPKPVILCVDDEPVLLQALRNQLKSALGIKFQYETATFISEAWDILSDLEEEECPLALVIADYLLPDGKGDAFLSDISKQKPTTPLLMLSGQIDIRDVSKLYAIPQFKGYIRKPWTKEEIMHYVTKALLKPINFPPTHCVQSQ